MVTNWCQVHHYPRITLVGSSKQKEDWEKWQRKIALMGYVVLNINIYLGLEKEDYNAEDEVKELLRQLHREKIEMADAVAVIRKPDGSVGSHTLEEILFASQLDKPIFCVEQILPNPNLEKQE